MVKFKCIVSGNVIQFEHEVDIVTTRDNPAYEEVKEEVAKEITPVVKKATKKTTTSEE
jgi:hypothetical protein